MLQKLGDHIAAARRRAAQFRDRQLKARDPTLQAELEEMERAWTNVAIQFEIIKSMEDFLLDAAKAKGLEVQSEKPPADVTEGLSPSSSQLI